MKKAWKPYGVDVDISAQGLKDSDLRYKKYELIILNDGLYQLIPVTKQMMEGIVITAE